MNLLRKLHAKSVLAVGLVGILVAGMAAAIPPTFQLVSAQSTLPTSCNDASNEVLWCGASTPQQIESDYTHGDGHNSTKSIQDIYGYFGISASDIAGMGSTAVAGNVLKDGEVQVNGKTVADHAVTAGREWISGSTKVTYNGTTFYKRTPSVSFLDNSLPAFVVFGSNGQFEFAILSSCGNPVVGVPTTPPKVPNYTIEKTVALAGSDKYGSDVVVNPGAKVDFRIQVDSTGTADVRDLDVKDVLPSGITYDSGTLTMNGKKLSASDEKDFFGGGVEIADLAPKANVTFQFEATAGVNEENSNCTKETLTNTGEMQAEQLPEESSRANVSVECKPTPPKPNYQIYKTVAVYGSKDFSSNVTVAPGSKVEYRIEVVSTGTADVENLVVKDVLPSGVTYIQSTLKLNGKSLTTAQANSFFGSGLKLGELAPKGDDNFTFDATAGENEVNNCASETLTNTGEMEATGLAAKESKANVAIECTTPTPTPTPTTPSTTTTSLVNTGPGNIIGAFVGFSVAGAASYLLFLRWKFARS